VLPTAQAVWLKHVVVVPLHVPAAQLLSVKHWLPSSAHVPLQSLFAKHVWLVPGHVPGLHWFEVHPALLVHASPGAWRAAHTAGAAPWSQNNPSLHWNEDVHAPPVPSRARHVPAEQNKPVAQPSPPHD
jgi:hypothetical protein